MKRASPSSRSSRAITNGGAISIARPLRETSTPSSRVRATIASSVSPGSGSRVARSAVEPTPPPSPNPRKSPPPPEPAPVAHRLDVVEQPAQRRERVLALARRPRQQALLLVDRDRGQRGD